MNNNTEQWLAEGKCSICRRKGYCNKPCRACKNRRNKALKGAVGIAMARQIMKKKV